MTLSERIQADYNTQDLTPGPHPMALLRRELPQLQDAWRATDLSCARHGQTIRIAGNVICRQRPGSAKGFVFISLEDETGIANAIVTPALFEKSRLTITQEAYLIIEGTLQNQENVLTVKARKIEPLSPNHFPPASLMISIDCPIAAGIHQHPEKIGRVAGLVLVSILNDHDHGIPQIPRETLVKGVNGASLPPRT